MKLNQLIPQSVKSTPIYRRIHPKALLATLRPPKAIFGDVYAKNAWGGATGTLYSGSGSRGRPAEGYVSLVADFIGKHNIRRVLDLGCGDFFIGRQIADACAHYIGVDVVPSVIEQLRAKHGSSRIEFQCLDITHDLLPAADVCLIRQVLQHLSNKQIAAILRRLNQFKYVIITEHFPNPQEFQTPNIDKVPGPGTRVAFGSAVMLDQPPFNMDWVEMMSAPAPKRDDGIEDPYTRGVIRSFLIGGDRKLMALSTTPEACA